MKAILALEDGTIFEGTSIGATGTVTGEACFNTAVMGYQEIITDPAHNGQILGMTYSLIGNYGIVEEDNESPAPQAAAVIIGELSNLHSSWRADCAMGDWLKKHNTPGIEGVDTRKLARYLRTNGSMRACVTTELSAEQAIAQAKTATALAGADLAATISTKQVYTWNGESRPWKLPNKTAGDMSNYGELAPVTCKVVAIDLGIKNSTLRALRQDGCEVTVVPATTTADEILSMNPAGLFLSSGPGDPAALSGVISTVKELLGKLPIFGLGLGMEVLGLALGGSTSQLKFGHRGANQPSKNLATGKVEITAPNQNFVLAADSLPAGVEVTHLNLNDDSVNGILSREHKAAGLEYTPAAVNGRTFGTFIDMINAAK
ncbi:MAG: glutamine-hydrolyzing carbamoyl-phosphate synthase small subunit [Akkermansia sp.]|nr:glutamine-hydrolyzing carbamoyl-phosphate synthase small subunit [Akkermansia sp.]